MSGDSISVYQIPTEFQYLFGESASGYWILATQMLFVYQNGRALKTSANQTSSLFSHQLNIEHWKIWYSDVSGIQIPTVVTVLSFYSIKTLPLLPYNLNNANFKLVYFSDSLCTFGNLIAKYRGGLNAVHLISKLLIVCSVFRCLVFRSMIFKWWFSNQIVD